MKQNKKNKIKKVRAYKNGDDKSEENVKEIDYITPQYKHIKELSILKYESEEKREQSLIQQASQMQTVFSFITAAVFMVVPIAIQYRGSLSLKFFFVSCSIIASFILASLVLSSISQWRWKTKTFPDIDELKSFVISSSDWKEYSKEFYCIDQWVTLVAKVQKEKAKLNNRRVKLILSSMICFYCSVATIVVSFIIAIFMMI